jgi:hypothetical protein
VGCCQTSLTRFDTTANFDQQTAAYFAQNLGVTFPQNVGYFLLDIFGRENAKPQTAIILGYIFILIVIGNLQGIVRLDEVVTLLKGILELFGTK